MLPLTHFPSIYLPVGSAFVVASAIVERLLLSFPPGLFRAYLLAGNRYTGSTLVSSFALRSLTVLAPR